MPTQALLDHPALRSAAWFAVFDGHGGKEVARYCAAHLHSALAAQPALAAGAVEEALAASFLALDAQLLTVGGRRALAALAEEGLARETAGEAVEEDSAPSHGPAAGCTACCALLVGSTLYVANAGDSRAVLCRGGAAVDLSVDHKPGLEGEKARILAAGGFVADGRVKGSLALSRALGDFEFKQNRELPAERQMVTALPEVTRLALQPGDDFLLLACDGVWDVLSSAQAVEFARQRLAGGAAPAAVCEALCDACCASDTRGSGLGCDNISVVLVVFKPAVLGAPGE